MTVIYYLICVYAYGFAFARCGKTVPLFAMTVLSICFCLSVSQTHPGIFLQFFTRCMECQCGLAMREVSVCPSVPVVCPPICKTRGL